MTCTRYKTTSTIVFDGRRSVGTAYERDGDAESDASDDDDDEAGAAATAAPLHRSPQPQAVTTSAKLASAKRRELPSVAPARRAAPTAAAPVGGAWQQPRKPARPPKVQSKGACRNAISARGTEAPDKAAERRQDVASMLSTVRTISKEVCPGSAFTFVKKVPIDGSEVEVPLVPTSQAAQMARDAPASLGVRLMQLFDAGDGRAVRELLVPAEPESHPTPSPSAAGFGAAPLLAAEQSAMAVEGEQWDPLFG